MKFINLDNNSEILNKYKKLKKFHDDFLILESEKVK